MKGTINIAKLFGIPIRVHWSFGILLLYIASMGWYKGIENNAIVLNFMFVMAVFVCVLLHELGHALTAKFYKVKTNEIIILPVGGVAMFEHSWITAAQEFVIAFAGPLTNFGIALLLWVGLYFLTPTEFEYIGVRDQILNISTSFSERLLWINLLIGGFNLIPTLPLDGGVMTRSLLTILTNRTIADKISFVISLIISLGFVVYSYYFHAVEYLIFAWFIYFSARKGRKE
jgi:Zn-dependent protease